MTIRRYSLFSPLLAAAACLSVSLPMMATAVTGRTTINGVGAGLTIIDAEQSDRVMVVTADAAAQVNGVTLLNGSMNGNSYPFVGDGGGWAAAKFGQCQLVNCAVTAVAPKGIMAMPADLKHAYEDARYSLEAAGSGGVRADNDANRFSVRFSGAEVTIDAHNGACASLTLKDYGWGSALSAAGPVTGVETSGKRLDRHYGAGLAEWFLNTPRGLEQGFTIASRSAQARGPLRILLGSEGGWTVTGGGDRVRLNSGAVTLDYAGLKAWDASGKGLPATLRATREGIEIEVDDTGATYPITVDPTLTQQQELTASDGLSQDDFGGSVAVSADGNTALVGAYLKDFHTQAGAAYVFVRSGNTWTQQQKLTASDAALNDYFGYFVALSGDGNTALLGAYGKTANQGAAYVFTRSGVSWGQQQKLTASDPANNDQFGFSLTLSSDGNTALVGAPNKNTNQGAAYVFIRSGGGWTQQTKLTNSDGVNNDYFAGSLALSTDGNTALSGAYYKNTQQGAAYVFIRSGTSWTQQQKLTASDAVNGDSFGFSAALSLDGNTALVGSPFKNSQQGAAYVWTRAAGAWTQKQKLTAADPANIDRFSWSLALSGDASTALVGAPQKNSQQGAAYTFISGATWTQQQKLTASDGVSGDLFGWSAALSSDGNTALTGAFEKNNSQGASYVFAGPVLPTVDSLSPASGAGVSQVFTFKFSSVYGYGYLSAFYGLINGSYSGSNACNFYYQRASNALFLANDTGSAYLGPLTPGSGSTLSNSQCTLSGTGTSASGSGNTLTLAVSIAFTGAFSGLQHIYGNVSDNGGNASSVATLGTWLSNAPPPAPTADSVSPSSGAGVSQVFTFKYSSSAGYGYLNEALISFQGGGSAGSTASCTIFYVAAGNALYLSDDAGTPGAVPLTPGSASTLSNSQCTLNGRGSSASGAGNTLTLTLSLSFEPAFSGLDNVYSAVIDNSNMGSSRITGTWVSSVPAPPTADSVSPASGSGASQVFTFKYSSTVGYGYLNTVYGLFNGALSGSAGCYFYYAAAGNALYLYNDAGTATTGPLTPGSVATLSNSQCTLFGPGSSGTGSGNTLSLVLSIAFSPAFSALHNIYGFASDSGGKVSAWQTLGSWGAPSSPPPTADSVSPASGAGTSQVFTFKYSSAAGFTYLNTVYSLFNGSLSGSAGCYIYYAPASGLFLYNDAGSATTGPMAPGSASTLSNSQCTLNGTGSSATGSGNTLSLVLSIAFKPVFSALQNVYGFASDTGGMVSGWQTLGTFTSGVPAPPTADSVNPVSGAGASQIFTFKYSSSAGFGYLNTVYSLFNGSLSASSGCYIYYVPASTALYLYNDSGTAVTGPLRPGNGSTLSNSQCTLNGAGSSASGSGNTLSLTLSIAFTPAFSTLHNVYGFASDNGAKVSGWQTLGSWGTPSTLPPTADSVSPNSGAGASQVFTFKYSSSAGFSNLNTVYSLFNGSLSASAGCYIYYVAAGNALYLYNDAGTVTTGPLTPGSASTLSNSQCTVNGTGSSASGSGNTLSLVLSMAFKPGFSATQNVYGFASDNGARVSGWQTLGSWTSGVPAPPTADSVSPASGSGVSQVFTFKYSSPAGSGYLNTVYSLFNGSLSGSAGCYIYYVAASAAFYLYNDAGSVATGPLMAGEPSTLSNSQCTLNGTGSSAVGSGNTLSLALSMAFKPAFSALQNVYGFASDNGARVSGWQTLGNWTP